MQHAMRLPALLLTIVIGAATSAASSSLQQPIATGTLLETQVVMPEGSVCWDVRSGSLAPASSSPASGFHTHGLVITFVVDGIEQIEYQDGSVVTLGPGEAGLIDDAVPHRHVSVGTTPRTNFNFELSCEPLANSRGNTGPLPIWRGPAVPYRVQVRQRTWQPGAQTAVHTLSGPTATYVLEGIIGRSTTDGVGCSGAGELYVSPVGQVAQNTNVGESPARTLDVDLWPMGGIRTIALPSEGQVPTPAC
ncbi:MAG TPA: hypothetical protein VGK54_13305 [Chloroflexota bacterium]